MEINDDFISRGAEMITRHNLIQSILTYDEFHPIINCNKKDKCEGCNICAENLLTEYEKKIKVDAIEEVIAFIEKWRDRQNGIGRKVVELVANEIIDSIRGQLKEQE